MKKHVFLITIIGLMLLALPLMANADTVANGNCGDNLTWMLDDEGLLTIYGNGEMTTRSWYEYRSSIKRVNISEGVTNICDDAFEDCTNLYSINIPYGISNLGVRSFAFCSSLKSIQLPGSVTEIGICAFDSCTSLTNIVVPDGVVRIGSGAFQNCNNLTSAIIHESVKYIDSYAFNGCSSLTHFIIPNELEEFGGDVLWGCSSLKQFTVPNCVTSIGSEEFGGCSSLTSIVIPNSVVVFALDSFYSSVYTDLPLATPKLYFLHSPEDNLTFINEDQDSFFPSESIYCYEYSDIDNWANEKGYNVTLLDNIEMDTIRTISLPTDFKIECGLTKDIKCSIVPDYDNPSIAWTSSNPSIISVEDGIITAHSSGIAVVTATVGSVSDSVTITSYIPADSFDLSPSEEWIVAKETLQMNIKNIRPSNAEAIISWSCSDTSYAIIDSNGLVTTKKPNDNNTIIISADSDNGTHRECVLHICYPVTAIELESSTNEMLPDSELQLIAHVTMRTQSCDNHLINFTSSNPSVATIDKNGLIHAINHGTTTITAESASGILESKTITVLDICEVEDGQIIDHQWGEAEYNWSDDYLTVTAIRICQRHADHIQTETVAVSSKETKAATCTELGKTTYTSAHFDNDAFVDQSKIVPDIPALGHDNPMAHTVAVAATCTAEGNTEYWHCTKCGKYFSDAAAEHEIALADTVIAALGHDPVHHDAKAPTCTEIGWDAYETCSRCDYTTYVEKAALGHDLEHHDAKAPTCTEIGWDAYDTCSRCDYTTYVEKAALGHDPVHHDAKAPTCTEIGWDAYDTCSRCDYTTYVEKSALGHDLVHHDAQAPTCTAIGWNAYDTCSRCDYTTYVEIPALGHDLEQHEAKAPTCTEIGWNAYDTCSRCDYTTYVEIPAKGHTAVTDAAVPATCTETGLTAGSHCSVCGEVIVAQEVIPAKGHTTVTDPAAPATCTETGLTEGSHCSVCNEVLVAQEVVPAKGHTAVTDAAVPATCTETGLTEGKHCSVCGKVIVAQEVLPAIEHAEADDAAVAPTCTETGLTAGKHCSVCGEVLIAQEVVPANGHTEVIDPAVAPTRTEYGLTEGKHCSVCGEILIPQESILPTGIIDSGTCGDNLTWTLDDKGILTIHGTGAMDDYEIQEESHIPVSTAPWCYFNEEELQCNQITEVHIENGITYIGSEAFFNYSGNEPIMLPDSVVLIHPDACPYYLNCSSIDSDTARAISKTGRDFSTPELACRLRYLYENDDIVGLELCNTEQEIESFVFPDGVTNLYGSFNGCHNLKSIVIPNTVTSIGRCSFAYCSNLTSIIIPESVKSIGEMVFLRCSNLQNIVIPDSVQSIGYRSFEDCAKLSSIVIPNNIQIIGENAFINCNELSNIVFLHLPEDDLRVYSEYGQQVSFDNLGISKSATIFCYEYTAIESWARDNGYPVTLLDDLNIESIRTLSLQEDFSIPNGRTYPISYSVFPDFDNPSIIWSSSNPSVASVNNGTITAHNVGNTVISATVGSVTECVTVTVFSLVESFDLNISEVWIVAKDTLQLNITNILPDNAETNIVWSSCDTSYASVDSFGFVTTKRPNNEAIIITANDNSGIYRECLLHICYPVTAIEFDENEASIIPYVDYQVTANVTMRTQSCVNHLISFTSSNPEIATVDQNGMVHGITAGTTTITATAASGVTASMTVNVRKPYELVLPTGLTEIDSEAFMGTACEVVIIPENCTAIGEYAFAGCTELLYVRIPASVTSYPASAFEGCNANLVIDWEGH